jgi:hypothetical protein
MIFLSIFLSQFTTELQQLPSKLKLKPSKLEFLKVWLGWGVNLGSFYFSATFPLSDSSSRTKLEFLKFSEAGE